MTKGPVIERDEEAIKACEDGVIGFLVDNCRLDKSNIPQLAERLVKHGVVSNHRGLWKDVSKWIDLAKIRRKDKAWRKEREEKKLAEAEHRRVRRAAAKREIEAMGLTIQQIVQNKDDRDRALERLPAYSDEIGYIIDRENGRIRAAENSEERERLLSQTTVNRRGNAVGGVHRAYYGSDPALTRKIYDRLRKSAGQVGELAALLLSAQKTSDRAKVYKNADHRRQSYSTKRKSMTAIANHLMLYAEVVGIVSWGWKIDPSMEDGEMKWVLYVDLPNGQVSWHSPERFEGPDYPHEWDGSKESKNRIIEFAQSVLDGILTMDQPSFQMND